MSIQDTHLDTAIHSGISYMQSQGKPINFQLAYYQPDEGCAEGWFMVDDVLINQLVTMNQVDYDNIIRVWTPPVINNTLRTVFVSRINGRPLVEMKHGYYMLSLHKTVSLITDPQWQLGHHDLLHAVNNHVKGHLPTWPLKVHSLFMEEFTKPFNHYFSDNRLEWPLDVEGWWLGDGNTMLLRIDM